MHILGRVEQLKIATQRVGKHERRVLSIGFVASTLYSGVPSLVRELRKHAPELDIQLLEMMSSQQIEALKTGRIDIGFGRIRRNRSEEHTSELQSLMRISYAVFCLKQKKHTQQH